MLPRSRAYKVLLVGVAVITACEPFTGPMILPTWADSVINVSFLFVQGAAVWCVGADLVNWVRNRRRV